MQTIALKSSRATIQDIANALHINAATVSRALNDHPAISATTKESVKKMADKLYYRPNKVASSLRSGKTNILGVIIPSAEINFFGSVLHGIEKIANDHNYNIIIYQSNESAVFEKKGIETMIRSQVDGVIISTAKETVNWKHLEELKKRKIPLILFDRINDELAVPSVSIDDYQGAFQATEHLIEQGYKRIAYIAGPKNVFIWNQRMKGYVDALKKNKVAFDKRLILYGEVSINSGFSCMQKLLSLKDPPDAVCCVEDFSALGAIQAIKAANIKIPGEIGVIGFANETFGSYITPSLSTVDQQTIRMGEEAALLFFKLNQDSFYKNKPIKTMLEPRLIIRNSSLKRGNSSDAL